MENASGFKNALQPRQNILFIKVVRTYTMY